jgi:hypothetical protein
MRMYSVMNVENLWLFEPSMFEALPSTIYFAKNAIKDIDIDEYSIV